LIGDEAIRGRFGVAEIGVHDAGATTPDLADLVVAAWLAVLAADLDFHVGQRLAAIDDRAVAGGREISRGVPERRSSSTSSTRMPSPGGITVTARTASARP
jgi:hypothetical protein